MRSASSHKCWDIAGLLQGSERPLPRKLQKQSEKGFSWPLGTGAEKARKRVEYANVSRFFVVCYFACSPEEFCEIFFSCLPGNFALGIFGDFWWFFSGLRLPRNEARKVLEKFGENSEQNSGQNSGRKFERFGKLSFCNFSGLIVWLISDSFSSFFDPRAERPCKLLLGLFWSLLGRGLFDPCRRPKMHPITSVGSEHH